MTTIPISKRLQTIAAYCPAGARVADIGSDHALLSAYLLLNNIASHVILGELNEGPYQAACRQINGLATRVRAQVRKGDGLAVLSPGEVDVICIAGMGGQLIVSILQDGRNKLPGVKRLVLQPNVGEELVRRWLYENGWQLIDETILEEDGVIYEILVAEVGEPVVPYEGQDRMTTELFRIGPFLWQKKPAILAQKWEREKNKWESIKKQIESSARTEASEKLTHIQADLDWMNEVIACLQTDKP
ncbi:tRNA (adenine-N(1))-methyltransferase [Brevibacillus fluminis]|uniref:tRNA (Adenine-N(1))-methyltransferase n=1 Tax=Brevibacillus fluminis TaxID=511487 RepID=A0A3M8D330_9BACL|nr:tRNA (adenine(22)-N(1))-methyltransferase TrmK [Brevibacillus fluminis]RNB82422.1 tRNA (adenine-N(1))-methyltransferase [Brevibacillus fluminis]